MINETLIVEKGVSAGDAWITIEPANVHEALAALQKDGYGLLVFLTCVDHLADGSKSWPARYEVVYQLRNMDTLDQLRVRTYIEGDPPHIDSVTDIYPPADWDEREMYDMFGVIFDGHPDLSRILMPDDWVGHPLRRDYPMGGETVEFSEEHEAWQTAPEKA